MEFSAAFAIVAKNAAVQLQHGFAACSLVQAVDILGDNCLQLALLFQLGKLFVGGIGLSVQKKHFVAVEPEEFLGIFPVKGVA